MDQSLRQLVEQLPSTRFGDSRHIGTCVMPDLLAENPVYASTIAREFDTVCVEHHMKWEPLTRRGECRYDFTESDLIVDWALANGLRVKGHTLVWHVTSPTQTWLRGKTDLEIREQVRRHVHTTCGHFYGRIASWDVVNEALSPNAGFAQTCFTSDKFTPVDFISDCFRWAQLADPNPKLLYNENKVESRQFAKSQAMFQLLGELKSNHVPISGVGLQAHFDASAVGWKRAASPPAMLDQVNTLGRELGLGVNVSEMDVRVGRLGEDVRHSAQSAVYGNSVRACYQSEYFEGMTFWGFTDASTWVTKFYERDQPLLFDAQFGKKPAYFAVQQALQDLVGGNAQFEDWTKSEWAPKSPVVVAAAAAAAVAIADLPDWKL